MSKNLLIFSILIFIVLSSFIVDRIFFSQGGKKEDQDREMIEIKKRNINESKIIGWTAYWDEKATLAALPLSIERYDIFTPVLYRIEPNGSLGKYTVLYKKDFLAMARTKNIPIMPQIGDDFDFERVSLLLYDQKIQDAFIRSMIAEAQKEGFSGWDIDIESLKAKDKDAYSELVQNMARELHKNNLKLAITVFARVGSDNNPSAQAQDYQAIGKAADEVRIMMYGAHDDESEPGGQAPLDWMRKVLTYATKNISREKITIGLSTHGYDWNNEVGEPLTYHQIQSRIGEATPSVKFDESVSSVIYKYEKDGQEREIWFENARSIGEKMLLAMNEFGVDKFAIWRIGAEDPQIWNILRQPRNP